MQRIPSFALLALCAWSAGAAAQEAAFVLTCTVYLGEQSAERTFLIEPDAKRADGEEAQISPAEIRWVQNGTPPPLSYDVYINRTTGNISFTNRQTPTVVLKGNCIKVTERKF